MAGKAREETDSVNDDPRKSEALSMTEAAARICGGYTFARAVEHLLRIGGAKHPPEDWLRFKVNPNLSFPPATSRVRREVKMTAKTGVSGSCST